MENTQISVFDRIKPYLLLLKVFEFKRRNAKYFDEEFQNKEMVITITKAMLGNFTYKELANVDENDYFDFYKSIAGELKEVDLDELEKTTQYEKLKMSKLVETLKVNSLSEIKEQLEKAEKLQLK